MDKPVEEAPPIVMAQPPAMKKPGFALDLSKASRQEENR
jgi:hypothetical protein